MRVWFASVDPSLRRALSHSSVVPAEIPLQISRQNQSQAVVPMHDWYRTLGLTQLKSCFASGKKTFATIGEKKRQFLKKVNFVNVSFLARLNDFFEDLDGRNTQKSSQKHIFGEQI